MKDKIDLTKNVSQDKRPLHMEKNIIHNNYIHTPNCPTPEEKEETELQGEMWFSNTSCRIQ